MKNIKIIPSTKYPGKVSFRVDLKRKGEMNDRGTRKIAHTEKFETFEVDGEEYGIMMMITKRPPRKSK